MKAEKRLFGLDEAQQVLPEIQEITASAVDEAEAIVQELEQICQDEDHLQELENRFEGVLRRWTEGVESLGAQVKGLWLVDFDNGAGYYCWRYPEPMIEFSHGYEDGYENRVRIARTTIH